MFLMVGKDLCGHYENIDFAQKSVQFFIVDRPDVVYAVHRCQQGLNRGINDAAGQAQLDSRSAPLLY
ncbi:hypothetical protein MVAC_06282 [Mycolicibacterium vaccae ATCC 25954]|uniref:Uncharacterized protein n=1 Tax=Mycolicibacterium vaccae ATCC 25954 TaxID=1194972 RepID=K0VJR7_MYCVA|nr:hypothetical protein MVAC_06282 [Mycolicibacterium vaccae ATCC 25954]